MTDESAAVGSASEGLRAALVLVGTPIGNLGDLAPRVVAELRNATIIAAEDTRRTRQLLTHAGVSAGGRLRAVHAHNEREGAEWVTRAVAGGARVVYATDAGMPGISDPGAQLVRACIDAGLPVEVVPGPSAVLTALVLSGFPADRFVFEGFPPRKGVARRELFEQLAAEARPVVLFEAPSRVAATLRDLSVACGPLREVAVARELTKLHEEVWRGTLAEAAGRAVDVDARGEHVLVLGPAPAPPEASDEEVEAHVSAALEAGLTARDAAARVARDLKVARRRAYDVAIRLRAASRGSEQRKTGGTASPRQ
jgi:16S rRNA (cytidine1402-2'-O)-methyltransferase